MVRNLYRLWLDPVRDDLSRTNVRLLLDKTERMCYIGCVQAVVCRSEPA